MNDKKHSLKKVLAAFLLILPLAACSQAPKEINGQPVHEVPFEQPLVLIPETGQDFYFNLKRDERKSPAMYLIGVTFLIPADDKKLMADIDGWSVVHGDTGKPGKDNLHFDIKLEYHAQGKVIPVVLKDSRGGDADKQTDSEWYHLWNKAYSISGTDKIINGKTVHFRTFRRGVANFIPADVPVQPDGYYKLSIRPAAGIRYPDIQFGMFIEHETYK